MHVLFNICVIVLAASELFWWWLMGQEKLEREMLDHLHAAAALFSLLYIAFA